MATMRRGSAFWKHCQEARKFTEKFEQLQSRITKCVLPVEKSLFRTARAWAGLGQAKRTSQQGELKYDEV